MFSLLSRCGVAAAVRSSPSARRSLSSLAASSFAGLSAASRGTSGRSSDYVVAEYIWSDGSPTGLRGKTRTIGLSAPTSPQELPKWNYDGSSTGQAAGHDSEVMLHPQAIYQDPFRGEKNILVLCDTYLADGSPHPTNKRAMAAEAFERKLEEAPWYGLEQEYTMMSESGEWPLGWPQRGYPAPQGPYYCGIGTATAIGREIVDMHYRMCLDAGVNISGVNAEVMPGQWEFQVGPCEGIKAGDDMLIGRYLLGRVAELFGARISYDPKPVEGDWNGAGCHVNFSTAAMRADNGYSVILEAVEKLGKKHDEHIAVYGSGNEKRLTGLHETASIDTFSWGVADRGASIRISRSVESEGKGFLEDRRPASNIDPYAVTHKIFDTCCL